MAEREIPITAEMFKFRAEDRSPENNLRLTRLLGDVLGRGRLRLCKNMRAGMELSDEAAEKIDSYVRGSIRRRYELPTSKDPQEFYMQQLKHARGVRQYYGEILPEAAQSLEGKDEIGLLSDRPSDLVQLLFSSEPIDPVLAYELHQHVLLSHISGMINARTLNGRLNTVLWDAHRLFDKKLFKGPIGAGQDIVSESFHDDEINHIVGFPHRLDRKPPTAHLKRIPFTVRTVQDLGLVYTHPRKKDDRVSIVKCIAKSLKNGGTININNDIQDSIGMEFVIMEDQITPKQLTERLVSVLESGSRKVTNMRLVHAVDNTRGQSPEFEFDERLQIWFEDITTPLEMVIFTLANYLNNQLEVGYRHPETGLYMGRGHALYELRRAREVAHLLFDEEIKQKEEEYRIDLDDVFINRSKLVAQDLRMRHKAA